jgi:hypothetical protein
MTDKLQTLVTVLTSITGLPSVYPYLKPQDEDSVVIYKLIDNVPLHYHGGIGLEKSRIQIDIYSPLLSEIRSLASLIKNKLDSNRNDFTLGYFDSEMIFFDNEVNLFRCVMDFFIF